MRLLNYFFIALLLLHTVDVYAKNKIFTVVIDPGHGGKDTGAVAKNGLREKDVVLSIARKLAKQLTKPHKIRVIMTRNSDVYLPLRTRMNIARKYNADLFIAVHADAYFNNEAKGMSVYALSQHGATNEATRWLVQQEKYSELGNIDFDNLHDKSRMLRSVLIDLAQTATIRDSIQIGNRVLASLNKVSHLHYQQVTQAPFCVLKSPDIPSILIETGYLSNAYEAGQLASVKYQDKIAAAISSGVQGYLTSSYHRVARVVQFSLHFLARANHAQPNSKTQSFIG